MISIILALLAALGYYVLIVVPASKEQLKQELMQAMDKKRKE